MPKHITRLMLLLVAFGIVAYAAKVFFTADSFFSYGHYRGNSVTEIASDKPKYQGLAACESCHAALYAEWSKGIHNSPDLNKFVRCEVCHGAGGVRNVPGMLDHGAPASDRSKNMKYAALTDTRKLCTLCHEQMPARPAEQRQIVVATHAGTQQCTAAG